MPPLHESAPPQQQQQQLSSSVGALATAGSPEPEAAQQSSLQQHQQQLQHQLPVVVPLGPVTNPEAGMHSPLPQHSTSAAVPPKLLPNGHHSRACRCSLCLFALDANRALTESNGRLLQVKIKLDQPRHHRPAAENLALEQERQQCEADMSAAEATLTAAWAAVNVAVAQFPAELSQADDPAFTEPSHAAGAAAAQPQAADAATAEAPAEHLQAVDSAAAEASSETLQVAGAVAGQTHVNVANAAESLAVPFAESSHAANAVEAQAPIESPQLVDAAAVHATAESSPVAVAIADTAAEAPLVANSAASQAQIEPLQVAAEAAQGIVEPPSAADAVEAQPPVEHPQFAASAAMPATTESLHPFSQQCVSATRPRSPMRSTMHNSLLPSEADDLQGLFCDMQLEEPNATAAIGPDDCGGGGDYDYAYEHEGPPGPVAPASSVAANAVQVAGIRRRRLTADVAVSSQPISTGHRMSRSSNRHY